jgi:hypothetical protein
MDAADLFKQGYEPPSVVDYGTLVELTADVGMLLPFGVAGLSGPLVPETPGGPDGPGPDATGSLQVPEAGLGGVGESSPEVQGGQGESAPAGAEAQGGGGGGGGGGAPVAAGGGGGSLPFTGLAAGALAAAGAGLTAAGAALRRAAQTRRFNRM